MKKILLKSLKYVLLSHIIIFILLFFYIFIIAIIKDSYVFNERMPWQETYLNLPLKLLLSINLLLYWSKFFILYFFIVLLINKFKITLKDIFLMMIVVIIYLSIKFGIFHYLANSILHGYDFNAPSLNPIFYLYF